MLEGLLYEQGSESNGQYTVVAAFQSQQPNSCYLGTSLVPLQGSIQGDNLGLYSFSVNGQFLSLTMTEDATKQRLMGSYDVHGGCANTFSGTITGVRYTPLAGNFSGSMSKSAGTLQVTLTQSAAANGDGVFGLAGSASFEAVPCFTSGSLLAESDVIGSSVNLVFSTDESSASQVTVIGNSNAAGNVITATSITVSGGACSGALGTATLVRQ